MDPRQIIDIRNLIKELGQTHTVILSTHILSEVKAICDRIIIINDGRIVSDVGTKDIDTELKTEKKLTVRVCGPQGPIASELKKIPGVTFAGMTADYKDGSEAFLVMSQKDMDVRKAVFYAMSKNSWPIIEMTYMNGSIEDVFISVVDEDEKNALKNTKE